MLLTLQAAAARVAVDNALYASGPTPYGGSPATLPGTIRAANFDQGGEGVAYHDTTAGNAGGAYRSTNVDVQPSSLGSYNVGWVADGEWLTYSVNVATSGTYLLQFRVASPLALGRLHATFGAVTTPAVAIPNTGGWQTWTTVDLMVSLAAGPQLMRVVMDKGGFNLADVTATLLPPPGAPAAETPLDGATGVTTSVALNWSAAGAATYQVHFGTTPSPPVVATGLSSSSFAPGALADGTRYFWQVVAQNQGGATQGPVWSFTTTPPVGNGDIVIYASDIPASARHGSWTTAADAASPNATKLATPDNGRANSANPLATPVDYVDVAFSAPAGTSYRLWLRMRALNDSKYNDAVWVQFSDALVNGAPVYPIGTTSGLLVNLATGASAASLNGWGWQNTAYWLTQPTTVQFATGGMHTLRVQVREDGVQFDQIVLSPLTYLNSAPGTVTLDNTIVPKVTSPAPSAPSAPAPPDLATGVSTSPTLGWTASGATRYDVRLGTVNPPPQVATDLTAAAYAPPSLTPGTMYFWQVVARNEYGATTGDVWSFTTAAAPPPPPSLVPTAYNAITDRNAYAEPALPPLGPAGSRFTDPVFGSRLLRVTDSNTRPGAPARSYNTPSASHQNAWNVTSRYFYLRSTDGTYVPYAFDPATMSASRLQASATGNGGLTIYSNTEPQFSYVSPDILYGTRQDPTNNWPILRQYDFSTGAYADLLNLGSVAPLSPHTYTGGLASSAGPLERVLAFFGGSHQDAHYLAMVFTPSQGSIVTVDTLASTVTSGGVTSATNIPLNFRLHHALIDKSGRYVILETTSPDRIAPRYAAPKYVWDTTTNVFVPLMQGDALSGGHYAAGFGTMINQDCCIATSWDAGQWQLRALAAPTVTGDLINPVLTPKEVYLGEHNSWNNAQPGALVPFVAGLYRYGNNTTPWRAWDDEIVAVQASGGAAGATVWRFAHHRSDTRNDFVPTSPSFWYEPRPNVSQDGRWAIFTSNWEKTLGADAYGQSGASFRQDVFLVELAPKP